MVTIESSSLIVLILYHILLTYTTTSQIIVTLEIYSHILPPLQEATMLQFNTLLTTPDIP
jgi:hypothetical protein